MCKGGKFLPSRDSIKMEKEKRKLTPTLEIFLESNFEQSPTINLTRQKNHNFGRMHVLGNIGRYKQSSFYILIQQLRRISSHKILGRY